MRSRGSAPPGVSSSDPAAAARLLAIGPVQVTKAVSGAGTDVLALPAGGWRSAPGALPQQWEARLRRCLGCSRVCLWSVSLSADVTDNDWRGTGGCGAPYHTAPRRERVMIEWKCKRWGSS